MENVADRHIVRLVCSMFSVLMGTFCLWLGILRTTPLYRTDSRYKFKRSNLIISSLSPAMKLEFHWNYSRLCVKSQHFRRKNLPPPSARQGTKMDDHFPDIKRRPLVFWGEGSILNFVNMAKNGKTNISFKILIKLWLRSTSFQLSSDFVKRWNQSSHITKSWNSDYC